MGMTRAGCLGKGMLLFPSTGEAGVFLGLLPGPSAKGCFQCTLGHLSGDLASHCQPVGLFCRDLESFLWAGGVGSLC